MTDKYYWTPTAQGSQFVADEVLKSLSRPFTRREWEDAVQEHYRRIHGQARDPEGLKELWEYLLSPSEGAIERVSHRPRAPRRYTRSREPLRGAFRIGPTGLKILQVLYEADEPVRRADIERLADVSFAFTAAPLQRVLMAGVVDRLSPGLYTITQKGREAWEQYEETGQTTPIPIAEGSPEWLEYFKWRVW